MDDAAALDAAVDMLDTHAAACDPSIRRFLRARQGPVPRLPRRHDHLDLVKCERQKAQILEQPTAGRQGVRGGLGNSFIVGTTRIGLTQKENREDGIDQQDVFDRVALFLAAITARLLSWILGTLDAPFGAIVANRGEAGGSTGGDGSWVAWLPKLPMATARAGGPEALGQGFAVGFYELVHHLGYLVE